VSDIDKGPLLKKRFKLNLKIIIVLLKMLTTRKCLVLKWVVEVSHLINIWFILYFQFLKSIIKK